MNRKTQTIILNILFLISILLIIGLSVFGVVSTIHDKNVEQKADVSGMFDDDEVYHVDKRTTVDFSDPILEQFSKDSKLVVSSAEESIELNLKQTGAFDVGVLNKTQKIKYRGTGRFYIEMSELTSDNIVVDEENKTVTILVPHSKLLPIEIDPDKFESEDAKKGLLAFGDIKFTAKEYNDLQVEVKTKLEKGINIKENRIKADENAIEEIIRIYEPIVKNLDDEYTVQADFINDGIGTE